MKIRWQYGIAFPLVLAVALGGLSAWLGRISQVDIQEAALNPDEPQYSMSGINGRRFDAQGRLKENLDAQNAVQYPKQTAVHFSRPDFTLYDNGRLLYKVTGRDAVYDTGSKQVVFEHDVVLTKEAADGRPAGTVTTERLTVDTEKRTAATDAPAEYRYGQSHGTSNGLTYDHQKGFLNLPSRVKATIYDPKNP